MKHWYDINDISLKPHLKWAIFEFLLKHAQHAACKDLLSIKPTAGSTRSKRPRRTQHFLKASFLPHFRKALVSQQMYAEIGPQFDWWMWSAFSSSIFHLSNLNMHINAASVLRLMKTALRAAEQVLVTSRWAQHSYSKRRELPRCRLCVPIGASLSRSPRAQSHRRMHFYNDCYCAQTSIIINHPKEIWKILKVTLIAFLKWGLKLK